MKETNAPSTILYVIAAASVVLALASVYVSGLGHPQTYLQVAGLMTLGFGAAYVWGRYLHKPPISVRVRMVLVGMWLIFTLGSFTFAGLH